MENTTATELYAQVYRQWQEVVELGLHESEDIVSGIMPPLARALSLEPDYLPALDLLSDMLMELGAYEEAVELVEKMLGLCPDDPGYRGKLDALAGNGNRRRSVRAYLHQKRQQVLNRVVAR